MAAEAAKRLVTLRTADDTARLRSLLSAGGPVLIAGAGLLGTEVAGVLSRAGRNVVLVGRTLTPMARTLGRTVAEWVVRQHQLAGVQVRLEAEVELVRSRFEGLEVGLSDGSWHASAVVVA